MLLAAPGSSSRNEAEKERMAGSCGNQREIKSMKESRLITLSALENEPCKTREVLPEFFRILDEDFWALSRRSMMSVTNDFGLGKGVLLKCCPEAPKTLNIKINDETVVSLLRSRLLDRRHLKDLIRCMGGDESELVRAFSHIPIFDETSVGAVLRQLHDEFVCTTERFAEIEERCTWLLEAYGNADAYAMDARVFSILRGLRDILLPCKAHALVVDASHKGIARFYVSNGNEAFPLRPPIYCIPDGELIAERLAAQKEWSGYRKASGVNELANLCGLQSVKSDKYVARFRVKDNPLTFIEVLNENGDPADLSVIKEGIEAALDSTDQMAIAALTKRATIATASEKSSFQRLAMLFGTSLEPSDMKAASEGNPSSHDWQNHILELGQIVGSLYPGSLSETERNFLLDNLCCLKNLRSRSFFDSAEAKKKRAALTSFFAGL